MGIAVPVDPAAPPRSILVVGTPHRAAFADMMLKDIHAALGACAEDAHLFLMDSAEGLADVRGRAQALHQAGRAVFLFDLNGTFNLPPSADTPLRRRFTLLLDHPYFHLEKLAGNTQGLSVGVVDRSHIPALADWGLRCPVHFMPHAGPDPDPHPLAFRRRDIDVLFCANLSPLIIEEVFHHNLNRLSPPLRAVVIDAIGRNREQGAPVHAALREAQRETTGRPLSALSPADLRAAVTLIEHLTVGIARRDIVEALARTRGLRIHIVGNAPEVVDLDRLTPGPDVRIHGVLPFDQVVALMRRSRLVVNANLSIADGSHERIWQAIAAGSMVLTHDSAFMREAFGDGNGILFLPGETSRLPDWLPAQLKDADSGEAQAGKARSIYLRDHVWRRRIRILTDVLDGVDSAG